MGNERDVNGTSLVIRNFHRIHAILQRANLFLVVMLPFAFIRVFRVDVH